MIRHALGGFLLGLAVAATPGPMLFLCLQRTLERGRRAGIATGLGIASADAVYGTLAVLGLAAVTAAVTAGERWVRLAGGLALIGIGCRGLVRRGAGASGAGGSLGVNAAHLRGAHTYWSALALTLANPATIVAFAAIFAGLGVGRGASVADNATTVAGVMLGSLAWWLTVVAAAGVLRARLRDLGARRAGTVSALAIAAFGIAAVIAAAGGG